jgi:D-alanyl-D-alanine carboxypeptidase/D-alanyl-D-alanine-endopeptidase (penicillin-binding protein 4)
VAGKSGTLTGWCANTKAAGNLMAKSGSMTRIKSHAGYVTTASGRSLAFAIIINNYNATSYQLKTRIEAIMVAMANFNG